MQAEGAPTSEQMARARALRRFNLRYVYLPLSAAAAVVVGLVGWLLFLVLRAPTGAVYGFVSAMVDLILIMNVLPLMLLCLIGPALLVFLVSRTTRSPDEPADAARGRLQSWLWRLDRGLTSLRRQLNETVLPRAVRPLLVAHAGMAALRWLGRTLRQLIVREQGYTE